MSNIKLNENELVSYFVINSELNMSPGKIAVQVSHVATIIAVKLTICHQIFYQWYCNNQKKIILKGKQKDLEKLIKQGFYFIRDIGCNEVAENSLTCVGLPPMPRSEAQKYIKRLQLL
jgi:PTH2 family peptidyl-tRNA hydrolase